MLRNEYNNACLFNIFWVSFNLNALFEVKSTKNANGKISTMGVLTMSDGDKKNDGVQIFNMLMNSGIPAESFSFELKFEYILNADENISAVMFEVNNKGKHNR